MRTLCKLVIVAALALPCSAQVLLDRTVATVNKQVILQSDLDLAIAYEKLSGGDAAAGDPQQLRSKVLDRLIDQTVILGALQDTDAPTQVEIDKQIADLKKQSGAGTEQQWKARLDSVGLTEQDVRDMTARQVQIIKGIEQRFRPAVRVRAREVERYYNEEYVPAMRKANQEPQPLASVRTSIEKILSEREMDELTQQWISTLRGAATVQRSAEAPPSSAKPSKQKEWVAN